MNAAKERKTPLQVSLDEFSSKLAVLIMIVCALVFGLCIYRRMALLDAFMFAVALAVAAIPEVLRFDRNDRAGNGNAEDGERKRDRQRFKGG